MKANIPSQIAVSLANEALDEDRREGSRFDRDGWSAYFIEDWKKHPNEVDEAWLIYNAIRDAMDDHKAD